MNILIKRHFGLIFILIGIILCGLSLSGTRILSYNFGDYITELTTTGENITPSVSVFDSRVEHNISLSIDEDTYDELLRIYEYTGDKQYIPVDITIDGTTVEDVGVRIKGTIDYLSLLSDTGATYIPSLVLKFDEYIPGRTYDGVHEVVIRNGSTEGVILENFSYMLRDYLGLTTPRSGGYTRVSLGDIGSTIGLISENIDDDYLISRGISDDTILYKSLSSLSLQYLGEDPTSYIGYFEQETSINYDDMKPLINFLKFASTSSDEEFADNIENSLDIDAYISYIVLEDMFSEEESAIMKLLDSYYLTIDRDSGKVVFIPWDQNLTFESDTNTSLRNILIHYRDKLGTDDLSIRDAIDLIISENTGGQSHEKNSYKNILKERILQIQKYQDMYNDTLKTCQEALSPETISTLLQFPQNSYTDEDKNILIQKISTLLSPTY